MSDLNNIVGATILAVEGCTVGSDSVTIRTNKGDLRLYFDNDYYGRCCVDVRVEDVTGDPADLVGAVVSVAEERVNQKGESGDNRTRWTFYAIRTTKGDLDLRWLGEDNGYYSVSVWTKWTEKVEESEEEREKREIQEWLEREYKKRFNKQ